MKRYLTILLTAFVMCVSAFADSYRDALEQYLQKGNVIDKSQYEQMMLPMASQLFPAEKEKAAAAIGEYASSQMISDMTDMYEPVFRKYVTEEELRELATLYSDPRFAVMQERVMSIVPNMTSSEEYAVFMQQFQSAAAAIVSDQPLPEDLPVPSNVSAEYKEAFDQYYQNAKVEESVMGAIHSVGNMLTGMLRKENVPEPEKKVETLLDYANRNMPNVLLAIMHKTVTLEELQLSSQIASKPSFQHATEASVEMVSDPFMMSAALFGKMAEWMEGNYPQYAAPIRNLVKDIETINNNR